MKGSLDPAGDGYHAWVPIREAMDHDDLMSGCKIPLTSAINPLDVTTTGSQAASSHDTTNVESRAAGRTPTRQLQKVDDYDGSEEYQGVCEDRKIKADDNGAFKKEEIGALTNNELYVLATEGPRSIRKILRRKEQLLKDAKLKKAAVHGPMKTGTKTNGIYPQRYFELDKVTPELEDVPQESDKRPSNRHEEGIVRTDNEPSWKHAEIDSTTPGWLHIGTVRDPASWRASIDQKISVLSRLLGVFISKL